MLCAGSIVFHHIGKAKYLCLFGSAYIRDPFLQFICMAKDHLAKRTLVIQPVLCLLPNNAQQTFKGGFCFHECCESAGKAIHSAPKFRFAAMVIHHSITAVQVVECLPTCLCRSCQLRNGLPIGGLALIERTQILAVFSKQFLCTLLFLLVVPQSHNMNPYIFLIDRILCIGSQQLHQLIHAKHFGQEPLGRYLCKLSKELLAILCQETGIKGFQQLCFQHICLVKVLCQFDDLFKIQLRECGLCPCRRHCIPANHIACNPGQALQLLKTCRLLLAKNGCQLIYESLYFFEFSYVSADYTLQITAQILGILGTSNTLQRMIMGVIHFSCCRNQPFHHEALLIQVFFC